MSLSSTILGDEVLSIVYPPKVLAEDVVSEGNCSPLPGTHGGEVEVMAWLVMWASSDITNPVLLLITLMPTVSFFSPCLQCLDLEEGTH